MFVIHTLEKGPPLKISIEGIIDETANFTILTENQGVEIHVNCRKVTRINSVGVKCWVDSLNAFRAKNGKLKFLEVTSDLIETMNYISNFILDGELVSLIIPYYCEKCKRPDTVVLTPQKIKEHFDTISTKPCLNCDGTMEIECDPEDLFVSIRKSTSY